MAQNLTMNEVVVVYRQPHISDSQVVQERVLDLDCNANKLQMYWITNSDMFRAAIPQDSSQLANVQTLMQLANPAGVALDWITE